MNKSEQITKKEVNKVPYAILNGLIKKIDEIKINIGNESNESEKKELEIKKIACESTLEKITSEVNDENFQDSIRQIKIHRDIEKLIENEFDDNMIGRLKVSELWPFFNEDLQSKLIILHEQVQISGNIKILLNENRKVNNNIPKSVIEETEHIISEAKFIRLEKGKEYLQSKLKNIEEKYNINRDIFSKKNQKNFKVVFREAKDWFANYKLLDSPEKLSDLEKRLGLMENQLDDSINNLNRSEKNKNNIKNEVINECDKWNNLLNKYNEKTDITNQKSDFKATKAEMTIYLQEAKQINELGKEDILNLQKNIYDKKNKYKVLNSQLALYLAEQTLQKLEKVTNIDEIKDVLKSKELEGHITYVNKKTFEGEYQQYTKDGWMVFYEKDDEWEIIVMEEALKNPENIKKLQKQLTHEFNHVIFENNEELKEKYQELLIEKDSEQWNSIKEKFEEIAKLENKTAPTKEGWQDDDILSELYAMKLGTEKRQKINGPKDELNNLIYTALLLGKTDIDKGTYRGYEDDMENIEREEEEETSDKRLGGGEEQVNKIDKNTKIRIDEIEKRIKDYLGSDEIKYAPGLVGLLKNMQGYHKVTKEMSEQNGEGYIVEAKNRTEEIFKDLDIVNKQIEKITKNIPNEGMTIFRSLWNETTFLSISDLVGTFNQVYEFFKRRNTRKEADHAAKIGMALFGNTDLGNEAKANQLKAEQDEVSKWEGDYSNLDVTELHDRLNRLADSIDPSPDQTKAVLRLLAKKGSIDWRSENLWKILNTLQGATELKIGDKIILNNPAILREKLHKAMGEIWDYDEFLALEKDNESNYESSKEKHNAKISNMSGQIEELLKEKLEIKEKDYNGYVDASEYEALIDYAIKIGKSNPKIIMFYAFMGLAKGILNPERAIKMGNLLSYCPPMEWFGSHNPPLTQENIINYCKKNFNEDYKNMEPGMQWKSFFKTQIVNHESVVDRVIQNTISDRAKNWDKDGVDAYAHLGDAVQAEQYYNGKSGQKIAAPSKLANPFVGALEYLEENAKVIDNDPNYLENFTRQVSWLMVANGVIDNVNKRGQNNYSRTNDAIDGKVPTTGRFSNHADWTFTQHRTKLNNFIRSLDSTLYDMLQVIPPIKDKDKDEKIPKNVQDIIDYLNKKYPEHSIEWNKIRKTDDVFERMNLIMKCTMSDLDSRGKLKEIIKDNIL